MEKKMTKKDFYGELIEIVRDARVDREEELVDFLTHQIELLAKKSNVKTKVQKENEELVEVIYEKLLEIGRAVTVTELVQAFDGVYTNQKLSALLRGLVNAQRVVRTEEKKKAYFSIAE